MRLSSLSWLIFLSLSVWLLQSCGQTGDLYWPEDEQQAVDEEERDNKSR